MRQEHFDKCNVTLHLEPKRSNLVLVVGRREKVNALKYAKLEELEKTLL